MLATRISILTGMLLSASTALGQATVGALLDAGASTLSPDEFREQIEQRMVTGPLPTGGDVELMYAANGTVVGMGRNPTFFGLAAPFKGTWKFDEQGRVCAGMRTSTFEFPFRCQYWFKLGDRYFLADSDNDRSAKVLSRTVKQ